LNLAYISFDQVPAAKGASTHIEAFVAGLAAEFGSVDLVTVSAGTTPQGPVERWPGVHHWELPALGASLIERVLHFRGFLTQWLDGREYDAIQFRSIFEGIPILKQLNGAAAIFEVNGLPSIELKYRYPGCEDDRELMRKLIAQEQRCAMAASRIVTPSPVTRDFLVSARGAAENQVVVIPNGADTSVFYASPLAHPRGSYRLLYFGTLSSWQGVEIAIRAVAQVEGATLTILGTGPGSRRNALARLAAKLGAAERISICEPVSQADLARALEECDAVLAPLLWNDRNAIQGCCPLKVLEGMAAGRPTIASNLRVVWELATHEEHLLLTEPGSVDSMVAAIGRLRGDFALSRRLAASARALIERRYTWRHAVASLVDVYREVIEERAGASAAEPVPVRS
jgi:glycosyltransferase involved in cell wall biosynthesis